MTVLRELSIKLKNLKNSMKSSRITRAPIATKLRNVKSEGIKGIKGRLNWRREREREDPLGVFLLYPYLEY